MSLAAVGTTALALLSVWIVAILLWPRMPNFMPLDLGPDGLPERWGETTGLRWFTPAIIATAFALFFVVLERVVMTVAKRYPAVTNVPEKRKYLALPPDARARALAPVRSLLWGMGGPVALVCVHVLLVTHDFATGRGAPVFSWLFVLLTVLVYAAAWLVCCLTLLRQFVRHETERNQSPADEPS